MSHVAATHLMIMFTISVDLVMGGEPFRRSVDFQVCSDPVATCVEYVTGRPIQIEGWHSASARSLWGQQLAQGKVSGVSISRNISHDRDHCITFKAMVLSICCLSKPRLYSRND